MFRCARWMENLHLDGELSVFLIYSGEGEHTPVQWLEESIPFSGEVELSEAVEEMIPAVGVRILHAEAGKNAGQRWGDARSGSGGGAGAGHPPL